jgi:hypothetical protein
MSIIVRTALYAACVLLLSSCQRSDAQDVRPTSDRNERDVAFAYYDGYRPSKGNQSECFGRLTFEVPAKPLLEWGLPRGKSNDQILGFSRILQGGQDMIHLADVAVVVVAGATPNTIKEMQRLTGVDKNLVRHELDASIKGDLSAAESLEQQMTSKEIQADPEQFARYKSDAAHFRKSAEEHAAGKIRLDESWHPTDWGLPNSLGYIAGPTLYAFILRNGYAFQFMSTGGEGDPPFEERLAAFKSLLQRFEYRPLYQVPTKPGLCIPYGFIADDGQGHFSGEVSYRYADSPGVIYTLGTGVEDEQNFRANEPMLEATARSTVAGLMDNAAGRKLKALGPKSVNIGARSGTMGGITTTEGKPGYSVYAGTSGWSHSKVLVPISLNMRSFDRETVPGEIKVDPPPFAQSLRRFELTLGSMRTRHTAHPTGEGTPSPRNTQ